MPLTPRPRFAARVIQSLALACLAAALAHDGPEHEIEELTERIRKEGASASLLLDRSAEYQLLNKLTEAAQDLEIAAELDPSSLAIPRELSRVYFAQGKTNEALKTAASALKLPGPLSQRAPLLMMRSEILLARREFRDALQDAIRASNEFPGNVEWRLTRSQLQAQLKLTQDRVQDLAEAFRVTGSGVLEAEWIDALIDNGQHQLALQKIDPHLKSSRWQSAWLIRRAKVHLATGATPSAHADLQAALAEINQRLASSAADATLLADRGLVYDLLGKFDDARDNYSQARAKGFLDLWLTERLLSLTANSP